jgi:hypothetical protein
VRRIVIVLGTGGLLLIMVAAGNIARVSHFNATIIRWSLLPLTLATVVALQVIFRGGVAWTWLALGLLCGFMILTILDASLYYLPGAFLLFTATLIDSLLRARLATVFNGVGWFLIGASGISLLFLGRDWMRTATTGAHIIHAPILVASAWVFLGTVIVFAAVRFMFYFSRENGHHA